MKSLINYSAIILTGNGENTKKIRNHIKKYSPKIKIFEAIYNPINVKNEVSKYTGKLKKFSQIIFLKDIHLNPDSKFTIMDNDRSSIIIHESAQGGKRIACADLYKKY